VIAVFPGSLERTRVNVERQLDIRSPLDRLEASLVRLVLSDADDVAPGLVGALRYVLSFARLTTIRCPDGRDVDVSGFLAPHSWFVRSALTPHLEPGEDGWIHRASNASVWGAVRELPGLVAATRRMRGDLLRSFSLDRETLEREVCQRHFVVVAGGGGGAGYGYAGAFNLLNRNGLQPSLIAGTSMGSLIGLFRARRRTFDAAAMFEAGQRLSWNTLFRILQSESQYGIPATLRLYLHAALGGLFCREDGEPLRIRDLEIPMRIITTGFTMDALKHDLAYYEHFMDDAVQGGTFTAQGILPIATRLVQLVRELVSDAEAVREIVFGGDELTADADALDAAGFSSAIPGLIHYDVLREAPRMKSLLDQLYAVTGIARMAEGGIVDNVPARVAYETIMSGDFGHRNLFILALDCFAPQVRTLMYLPLQQAVRVNVARNIPYAHLYFPMQRVLNALNLVPPLPTLEKAIQWTMEELDVHVPFIRAMCEPLPVLADG